jgi:hypothetical protein
MVVGLWEEAEEGVEEALFRPLQYRPLQYRLLYPLVSPICPLWGGEIGLLALWSEVVLVACLEGWEVHWGQLLEQLLMVCLTMNFKILNDENKKKKR